MGGKYETICGQLVMLGFTLGQIIMGFVAIYVRDYKTFQILLFIPCFALLGSYFVIPESPRWLISKKRYHKAAEVIKDICEFNQVI